MRRDGEKEVPAVSFHEEPVRTSFGGSLNEEVEFFVLCINISSDIIINVSNLFQRHKDSL